MNKNSLLLIVGAVLNYSFVSAAFVDNDTPKWIYNSGTKQCLYAQSQLNRAPMLKNCESTNKRFNWYISNNNEGYIVSVANTNRCLTLSGSEDGELLVSNCNDSNTFTLDSNGNLYSSLTSDEYCVGIGDYDDVVLEECEQIEEQEWSIWDRNPSEVIDVETQTVWIYNENLEQCLISNGSKPIIDDCDDTGRSKWEVPVSGDGFFKSLNKHLCLNVIDIDVGTVSMGNCDNNAILFDIDYSFNRNTINSPLDESKCLGYKGDKATTLSMVKCNKNKEDQQWKITTVNPSIPRCGSDYGKCSNNQCCNKDGICGTGNNYCGKGCQTQFGKCNTTTTRTTTTTTTITTTINSIPTSKPVWIYNEYTDKCLYAPDYVDEIPTYEKCESTDNYQWYVVNTKNGSYFKSKSDLDLCMRVADNDNSKLLMGECDENAILRYIKIDKTIVSILSDSRLCLGNSVSSSNNVSSRVRNKVKLYDCEEEIHEDQIWSMMDSKPIKKTTTTTTTTTTKKTTTTTKKTTTTTKRTTTTTTTKKTTTTTTKNPTATYTCQCGQSWCIQNCFNHLHGKIWNSPSGSRAINDKNLKNAYCTYNECSEAFDDCRHPTKNDQYTYWKKCKAIIVNDFKKYFNDNYNIDDSLIGFNNISTTTTKKTTTTKSNSTPSPTPNDGKCGPNANGAICRKGECCSKYGYCGKTKEYCGDGCQDDFGRCENGGRCGANFGNCLNKKECCSQWNYCGSTNEYCGGKCQKEYGNCSN